MIMAKDLNEITFPVADERLEALKKTAGLDKKIAEFESMAVGRGNKRKMYAILRFKSNVDLKHVAKIVSEYKQ